MVAGITEAGQASGAVTLLPAHEPRPFKAAQSYGPADGDLFFGRDAEGAMLSRFMAERPVSVIAAPSGTGKTSLLHAKVMPLMERDGWLPVYARPGGAPLTSLQHALVEYLLPDPAVEADVLVRLARALPAGVAPTLEGALQWHSDLPKAQRVRWRLFSQRTNDEFAALPMVCRALRGSLSAHDLIEHFEALVADGEALGLAPPTPLETVADRLRSKSVRRLWNGWRERFTATDDFGGALESFQNDWAPLRPGLIGVVIILDQFEELFTQFEAGEVPQLIERLTGWLGSIDTECGMAPVHLALSLRKEFFADLLPHLRPFGAIERLTYILDSLPADQARLALTEPARLFGLTFAPPGVDEQLSCVAQVLALALEDGETFDLAAFEAGSLSASGRFSPVMVSLVGAHLWDRLQLPANTSVAMPLTWESFKRLVPHLDDVFSTFLEAAMRRIEEELQGRVDRFDALEMLDRLVTSTGFRNIIAEVDLVEQLPLQLEDAQALVDIADHELKLIRRESRRGGFFVEIMHERLISHVRRLLAEMRRSDPLRASLGPGHATLQLLADEPDPTRDSLPDYLRAPLVAFLPRLRLGHLAAKNLLRSMLWAGPDVSKRDAEANGAAPIRDVEWDSAMYRLAKQLGKGTGDSVAAGGALLYGARLERAIEEISCAQAALTPDMLRSVLRSALADRTCHAGERILRAFSVAPLAGAACD